MTTRALADWLDAALNPIALKELRQAVRGRFLVATLIFCLLAYVVAIGAFLFTQQLDSTSVERVAAGPSAFMTLYMVLFTACVFLIPLYVGLRMMAEHSDTNVDLLFITTIRPRTIIIGKLQAAAALTALLFSATLPFLMFSYVLRGVDFVSILALCVFGFMVVMSQSVLALFIGSLPSSKPFKLLMGVLLFGFTIAMYAPIAAISGQFLRSGGTLVMMRGPELGLAASLLGMIVMVDVVLLVLAVAVVTPATANRALPIRVLLTALLAVSLLLATYIAFRLVRIEPLQVWAAAGLGVSSLVLLSAVGEREEWGRRVARTIPVSEPKRALAFLFYSGGGGTLWAIAAHAAIIAAFATIAPQVPTLRGPDVGQVTIWMIEGSACLVAYAFTALLIRRKLFSGRIQPKHTWAIGLVLFLLGAVLPPLFYIMLFDNTPGFNSTFYLANIANPFPMTDVLDRNDSNVRKAVLAIWVTIVVIANADWMRGLLQRFRRPESSALSATELAAE